MPAVKLINPNRVNIHGILFERGIPRYVTSEVAEALASDERFEIRDGEDAKSGVKIKRSAKVKPAIETELTDDTPPTNDNSPTGDVIEV